MTTKKKQKVAEAAPADAAEVPSALHPVEVKPPYGEQVAAIEEEIRKVETTKAEFKEVEPKLAATKKRVWTYYNDLYPGEFAVGTPVDDLFEAFDRKCRLTTSFNSPSFNQDFSPVIRRMESLKKEWQELADIRVQASGGVYVYGQVVDPKKYTYQSGVGSGLFQAWKDAEKSLTNLATKVACERAAEIRALYNRYQSEIADYLMVIMKERRDSAFGLARFSLFLIELESRGTNILGSAGLDPVKYARRVIAECQNPLPRPLDLYFPRHSTPLHINN